MTFDPVALLQSLTRIDTTNPPGNEAAAIDLLDETLSHAGISTRREALDPSRPNLIARVPGAGTAPPLLIHGHVDVVPTADQEWSHPPFSGDVVDGFVWGRGTLDMKGPVVTMVDALTRLAEDPTPPPGDVILCLVADEEAGGDHGVRFLVEQRPEIFEGVRYALGEFGGFPLVIGGTRFYPIQVAERLPVRVQAIVRGPGGHASLPLDDTATAEVGRVLVALARRKLPIHLTDAARLMIEGMVEHTTGATRAAVRMLLDERTAGVALRILRSQLGILEPMLRNMVTPTIVEGGTAPNVVPARVDVTLDGRMLPGVTSEELLAEVRAVVGDRVELICHVDAPPVTGGPDMGLYETLADAIRGRDPDGVPLPYLMPATTDGRWLAALGIQHYGFTPMTLPDGFQFQRTVHAADERIPVEALEFGAAAYLQVMRAGSGVTPG